MMGIYLISHVAFEAVYLDMLSLEAVVSWLSMW